MALQPERPLKEATARVPKWLRLAGYVALGAVGSMTIALAAASYPLSGLLLRPRLKRLSQLKSPHTRNFIRRVGIEFEDVMIPSFDGTRLLGWWMQARNDAATIVMLHGVSRNRTDLLRAATMLRRAGLNVLIYDGRAHGNSDGRYVTYGFYERRDVETAIEWLIAEKKIDRGRIGLAGESMGAAIAIQVAARNPYIRAVWADSPFASLRRAIEEFARRTTHLPAAVLRTILWTTIQVANYRGEFDLQYINPLGLAIEVKCPVYIVHGTADQLIATAHSSDIYAALAGRKEIWFVEGARHARSIRYHRTKEEYRNRFIKFFTENLRRVD